MNSDDCLLASTGADFVGPISLALVLLVVGAVIVVLVRRGRGGGWSVGFGGVAGGDCVQCEFAGAGLCR